MLTRGVFAVVLICGLVEFTSAQLNSADNQQEIKPDGQIDLNENVTNPCAEEDPECPCHDDIYALTYMNNHMQRRIQKLECCCKELRERVTILEKKVPMIAKNCGELYKMGYHKSGIYYLVNPELSLAKNPFSVYCDMENDGGGWTVIQNRFDGSVDFYRVWDEYKNGFGSLTAEHWLGLDYVWAITSCDRSTLHIYLEDFDGINKYATYEDFYIESEANKYKFHIDVTSHSGTLPDHYNGLDGVPFTTKDQDNDSSGSSNCAVVYPGGHWFRACHAGHLNGRYSTTNPVSYAQGIIWRLWKGYYHSLKKSTMKIRPMGF